MIIIIKSICVTAMCCHLPGEMWYMEKVTETATKTESETCSIASEEEMNTSDTEGQQPAPMYSGQRDARSQKHYTAMLLEQLQSATM